MPRSAAVRGALEALEACPCPKPVIYRRLKNEIQKRWSPGMRAALQSLEVCQNNDMVATFGLECAARLVITFPAGYPFRAPAPSVEELQVEHPAEVGRALRKRLPPPLVAAVRRHLRAPRRVPLKAWAYHRLRRARGRRDAAACMHALSPRVWSPCMGLETHWDQLARLVERCRGGGAAAAVAVTRGTPRGTR